MRRNTRDTAISREEFHAALADFIEGGKATVGDPRYGRTAWIWVDDLGHRYHLNADTTAAGVAIYLDLLRRSGGDLPWSVVANERGVENKAAFGPEKWVIEGFHLYRGHSS
jgi:hypothetical protein